MAVTRDIVMTCCRDEEDVIETFIRFYLEAGFDAVHIIDNGSHDRTPDIVESLIAEGLAVTFEVDDRVGYERYLTTWFRTIGERLLARWLFFLDCDEFILFPCPAKQYLDRLPEGTNRLRVQQKEVYPSPSSAVASGKGDFLLSRRIERHFNDTTKDYVRFHPEARVYGGKHRIDIPGPRTVRATDIFIRHYKYRTPEQAAQKERNRCTVQRIYSDPDLTSISAFGLERARDWIEYCRAAAARNEWRSSFDADAAEDHEMADWAVAFLNRTRNGSRLSKEKER
jgi:glycosyltransferase involved in cell wall biosynthesis